MACILLWSSAVRVHDSLVYRNVDVTRELISRILELIGKLLSFQTGLNLVNTAVNAQSDHALGYYSRVLAGQSARSK